MEKICIFLHTLINVPSFHTNSATLKELVKLLRHGKSSFFTLVNRSFVPKHFQLGIRRKNTINFL